MNDVRKDVASILGALTAVILFGTLAYHIAEGWGLFESLYMTVITITTTGYGELFKIGVKGRIISMFLMFFGIGIFFYSMNVLMPLIIERRIKMREIKRLAKMENHVIVCGFGVMGKEIAEEFLKENVVIIDNKAEKVSVARESGYLAILGDATEEEVLIKANIEKAKALIACMTDASNAFTIMAAKELNPKIYTFAILRSPDSEKKLKRVNVDFILSPYRDAARKVIATLKRPATIEFIESIMSRKGEMLTLEKVEVGVDNKSLRELDLRKKTGCTVVAIERNGKLIMPEADTVLKRGDFAYLIGGDEALKKAEEILGVNV
ncbi:MAG: potassium channel protein [Archaeoglobaceae archaeon]|nr:potassium channel protein [Archaeoglobaceae archaeon]